MQWGAKSPFDCPADSPDKSGFLLGLVFPFLVVCRGRGPAAFAHGIETCWAQAGLAQKSLPATCRPFFNQNFLMMKNVLKNGKLGLFSLLLLFGVLAVSAASSTSPGCSCCPPNVTVGPLHSGSVSFSWSPVAGAVSYKVWYHEKNSGYTSPTSQTSRNSISFSGLPTGVYVFYFATVCDGETSSIIITDDLMM